MDKVYEGMTRVDLKDLLQKEVEDISLEEIYELSFDENENAKYIPREYKKHYNESVLNVIISRFATLKNTHIHYEGTITEKEADDINTLLNDEGDLVEHVLNIIVVFVTYLMKRPVHLPGTVFPGMVSIYSDGKEYYCPIKKYHITSKKSVCRYCIAKEAE